MIFSPVGSGRAKQKETFFLHLSHRALFPFKMETIKIAGEMTQQTAEVHSMDDPIVKKLAAAVKENDAAKAKHILEKVKNIHNFLECAVKVENEPVSPPKKMSKKEKDKIHPLQTKTWWSLVAECGAFSLIKLFLESKITTSIQDEHGNNFVHTLVVMSILNAEKEDKYVHTFETLVSFVPAEEMAKFLMEENVLHLRPLEMAAQYGAWKIFFSIFSAKPVYVVDTSDLVLNQVVYHNITGYEDSSRMLKSPVFHCMTMTEASAHFLTQNKSYLKVLKSWTSQKECVVSMLIKSVVVLKMLLAFAFYCFDQYLVAKNQKNRTTQPSVVQNKSISVQNCLLKSQEYILDMVDVPGVKWSVILLLLLGSLVNMVLSVANTTILLVEIHHKMSNKLYKHFLPEPRQLVGYFWNTIVNIGHCILFTAAVVIGLCEFCNFDVISDANQDILFYFVLLSSSDNLVSFVVFSDSLGPYFLMIEGMILHMAYFSLLYVLVSAPFLAAQRRLTTRRMSFDCTNESSFNIKFIYKQALALINIPFPAPDSQTDKEYARGAYITQIIFIFLVGIIMVNFLIALFSFTANEVNTTREVRLMIARLRVSYLKFYTFFHYTRGPTLPLGQIGRR